MTIPTFADLGVSDIIAEALAGRNIVTPFHIQRLVMADAMAGRDVLARSRTGSGKTLAFGIPIVEQTDPSSPKPSALVLVPTRELAIQVNDEIEDIVKAKGLKTVAVYGGTKVHEQGKRAKGAHIVIATPGRLEDLVGRGFIPIDRVSILVLDEADRMLDMGFQPQVDRIVKLIPGKRQTMFFSATLEGLVGHLARSYTKDAVLHEVQSAIQTVDEAEHRFIPVTLESKVDTLIELSHQADGAALVFVNTKRGADLLRAQLNARGVEAVAMHGDLSQQARQEALARFSEGKVNLLIATDVAARGLDLDNITQVINFDPPENHKAYVHRVGRTARAGRSGTGITLVLPVDQSDMSMIASSLELKDEFEEEGLKLVKPRKVYSSSRGRGRGSNAFRRRRIGL